MKNLIRKFNEAAKEEGISTFERLSMIGSIGFGISGMLSLISAALLWLGALSWLSGAWLVVAFIPLALLALAGFALVVISGWLLMGADISMAIREGIQDAEEDFAKQAQLKQK